MEPINAKQMNDERWIDNNNNQKLEQRMFDFISYR